MAQKFGFISPAIVSSAARDLQSDHRERATSLLHLLAEAPRGKLFFLPYNIGQHWMLGLISPWEDQIYWFDPLGHPPHEDFLSVTRL